MQDIYGHIIDCLNIYPEQSLHEITDQKPRFKKPAQSRSIQYESSDDIQKIKSNNKIDWIISSFKNDVKNTTADNVAIIIEDKLSLFRYLRLRATIPIKHIIRIDPDQNYLSSEKLSQRFTRTYKNTSHKSIIGFVVALKVALRPAYSYPVMVCVL